MKTINLCDGRSGCCPKLAIDRSRNTINFTLADKGVEIKLKESEARNLALTILEEVGK